MKKKYLYFTLCLVSIIFFAVLYFGERSLEEETLKLREKEILDFTYSLLTQSGLEIMREDRKQEFSSLIKNLDERTNKRITVIDTSGKVILDSREDPLQMGNHRWRPEVQGALKDSVSFRLRYSTTLSTTMLYCAVPIKSEDKIYGILRVGEVQHDILNSISNLRMLLFSIALIYFLTIIVTILFFNRIQSKAVSDLVSAFKKISLNEFDTRMLVSNDDLLYEASTYFNIMAERLKDTFNLLRERENELTYLLAALPFPIALIDSERRFLFANSDFKDLFTKARDKFEEPLSFEDIEDPFVFENIRRMLTKETDKALQEVKKIKGRTYQISIQNLADPPNILIFAMDITDTYERENLKKELISYVSHDLRTPLTIIKGYAETALEETKNKNIELYLKRILSGVEELNHLVEKLNTLSRLENVEEISTEHVNLKELIRGIADTFEYSAKSKGLDFSLEIRNVPKIIETDPEKIRIILTNLLDNAVKFTEKGKIEVKISQDRNILYIVISDTGQGIPEEFIPKIFERFFTLDKSRGAGFGLGLAIVKHAVQLLNGSIEVKSKEGQGTVFTISIPLLRQS